VALQKWNVAKFLIAAPYAGITQIRFKGYYLSLTSTPGYLIFLYTSSFI
jgi:hypothetical protein